MSTYRRIGPYWIESKQIVDVDGNAAVKQVTCCCEKPAARARECADARGDRSTCRCDCHRRHLEGRA